MNSLLSQSLQRMSNEHMKDKVALEVWEHVVLFIKTGKIDCTLKCYNAFKYPRIEKATNSRINGWCKLVALKPEWINSWSMEEVEWTASHRVKSRNWLNHWDLKLHRTTPPDDALKAKLIAEYGRPPGY